jgi:hypothetical protein
VACGGSAFTSDTNQDAAAPPPVVDAGNVGAEGGSADGATGGCTPPLKSCGPACVDTQMDPNNCGGCGSTCTGGTCTGGVCKLLGALDGGVPAVDDQACLTIDAVNVYVATGQAAATGGQIYKVPIAGGPPQTIVPNQAGPRGIVTDGKSLYWAATASGEIWKSDTSGGGATAIVTGQMGPIFMAIDTDHVYWNSGGDGAVWQTDRDGSNTRQLASGLSANHLGYLAVDAANVYYTDLLTGIVWSAAIGGGSAPVMQAQTQARPTGVAVTPSALFWSNAGDGTIHRKGLGAVSSMSTIASSLATPNAVVHDGSSVYFSEAVQTGSIAKTGDLGLSGVTTLAGNQPFPGCIAVDSTSVYWIDQGGGTISKTGK